MSSRIPIAVGAGLLSAIVFVSVAVGQSVLGFVLAAIMPLPILMVGLAHGWASAVVAGTAASLLILLVGGAGNAAAFALSHAAPSAVLSYLALLNRPGEPDGESSADREWYPPGRLVLACVLLGAALSLALIQYLGGTPEALKASATSAVASISETIKSASPDAKPLSDEEKGQIAEALALIMPASFAVTFALLLMLNLWLAGRLTRNAGLPRPWPDLTLIEYPRTTALAFAVATAVSMMDGWSGMAGKAVSGALFLAYLIAGLAIVHHLTRGAAWRPFALALMYLFMVVPPLPTLINPVPLIIAALGLADAIFAFRHRPPPQAGGMSGGG